MKRKWFGITALVAAATLLFSLSSCARNRHLVAIQVEPPGATFEGVGAEIQFKALGTYIHPPSTKDITSQVQWSIDSQFLVNIISPGLVQATSICGSGNVIASLYDSPNYVFGSAFVTGAGIGTSKCNQALLTVNVSGNGTVASSGGASISCPTTCSAVFPLGSSVGLTATPGSGATSVTWGQACSSASGNACTVTLSQNEVVTATFN